MSQPQITMHLRDAAHPADCRGCGDIGADPVLTAIRTAPQASPETCKRLLALDAEVTDDPGAWTLTTAQLLAATARALYPLPARQPPRT